MKQYKLKPERQKLIDILLHFHHRKLNKILLKEIKNQDKFNKTVLELGAGVKPYRKYFKIAKVITTDIVDLPNITEIADVQYLKYNDNSFNFIICNNVFEHLNNPRKAAKEIFRCLRKNGKAIIVTPFLFPIHDEPFDFFRYTEHGLKNIFKMFDDIRIIPIYWLCKFSIMKKFVLYYVVILKK